MESTGVTLDDSLVSRPWGAILHAGTGGHVMSATPPTNPPAPNPAAAYPEPTQADQDAQFASVVWADGQQSAGNLKPYEGTYIAVLGDRIIDHDADADELGRRVEARGNEIPVNRVVLQYVHRPEDFNWKCWQ
jgi:hypothetical protein